MSHIAVWQWMVDHNQEMCMVFEDDAVIPSDFKERGNQIIKDSNTLKNPAQWDAATVEKMKERIFTVTMDPASDPKELAELFKAVLKREDLDLTREKLRIEMQSDTERAIAAFADEVKGDPEAEALVQELRKRVMAKMERNAG